MFRKLAISIALILPVLFVFKSILLPGSLAWGDAPHFFPKEAKELVSEPLAWVSRGSSFGAVNKFIFLWPLMFIYGLIGNNDLAVRILFYIPAIIFVGLGTYFLTKYLKLSKTIQFFSILIYLLNTYFLLLIDGGQVGVALAYGIFPLGLLFLKKLLDFPSVKSFLFAFLSLFALSVIDPRVALICIVTGAIWSLFAGNIKCLIILLPLGACLLGFNMYWVYPLMKNGLTGISGIAELVQLKWYHPLFLLSPHWPENIFGKISSPPFYFAGIPILVFLGAFLKKETKYLILFLFFGFLSLGILPLGFAFRDSTKFFIPLMLFAGILIGKTLEKRSFILHLLSYIYILFLVYPAFLGRMNFVLSARTHSSDYQKIYENLKKENEFFRTVWFPEKHPIAYETEINPAVDARDLVNFQPFASMNASEDIFNFLNNDDFVEWFKVLGIKYLILSDNPREISKNEDDKKSWNTILNLVDTSEHLKKVDWGVKIPIYKIENPYPQFYTTDSLIAVVGPDLSSSPFIPTIYFEDGKWDPRILEGKNADSVKILFNGKDKNDLALSFLQNRFISLGQASKNEWAVYSKEQYLKYKYELLIRGVKFMDFDYAKGIAFSTQKGEKIEFKFNVPETGEYVFAYRGMVPANGQSNLKWETISLKLPKGNYTRVIENNFDLQILNVAALIPKKEFDTAVKLAETYLTHFGEIKGELEEIGIEDLEVSKSGPLKYGFENKGSNFWVIYNEKYSPLWKLKRGRDYFESVPVFSMINGFYVRNDWRDLSIEFKGQENVRWGVYFSALSLLISSIAFLLLKSKNESFN